MVLKPDGRNEKKREEDFYTHTYVPGVTTRSFRFLRECYTRSRLYYDSVAVCRIGSTLGQEKPVVVFIPKTVGDKIRFATRHAYVYHTPEHNEQENDCTYYRSSDKVGWSDNRPKKKGRGRPATYFFQGSMTERPNVHSNHILHLQRTWRGRKPTVGHVLCAVRTGSRE